MNAVTCIKFDDKLLLVMMCMVCLGHREEWLSKKLNIVIILLYTHDSYCSADVLTRELLYLRYTYGAYFKCS